VEALLATVALLVLIAVALVVTGRSWPSSYRRGGFRTWSRGGSGDDPSLSEERGDAVREDDDVHWQWDERDDHDDG
jgi:hypothetical protein